MRRVKLTGQARATKRGKSVIVEAHVFLVCGRNTDTALSTDFLNVAVSADKIFPFLIPEKPEKQKSELKTNFLVYYSIAYELLTFSSRVVKVLNWTC